MRIPMVVMLIGGLLAAPGLSAQGGSQVPALPSELEDLLQQKDAEAAPEEGSDVREFEPAPRSFDEMVRRWMTPMKLNADGVVRLNERYAYPHPAVPLKMEIVREEGGFIWLKGIPPENPDSALHEVWVQHQIDEAAVLQKRKFDREVGSGFFVDYQAPIVPPDERSSVRFTRHQTNLPNGGKWQMGFELADMNGDGHDDLVCAPPRLATSAHPRIFLGDGTGNFSFWSDVSWNASVPFDYGDVAVADFDLDGYMDIAIAIHFKAQYVLFGSAGGEFRRYKKLPSPESRITSRAVAAADFDADGRQDLVFQAELDMDLGMGQRIEGVPTAWVVLNTEDGWKLHTDRLPKYVIGDRISTADMDGDQQPDIVLSSNSNAWRWLVPLNRLPDGWGFSAETNMLGNAFHFDTAPSRKVLDNGARPVYAAFRQSMRTSDGKQTRTGLVRYVPGRAWQTVTPEIIHLDVDDNSYYLRLAVGDVNGDGLEDLVVARRDVPALEIWTQSESGRFFLERDAGVEVEGRVFDLQLVDFNRDGADDLIIAAASLEADGGRPVGGGISVWISQPAGA